MTIYDEDPVLRILSGFDDISVDRFYDRLRLQKLAYLIQEIGGHNSFAYSWYVRGPYSSSLTSVLYMGDEMGIFEEKFKLKNNEQDVVNKIHELVENKTNDATYLELTASVWFLMPNKKIEKEDIIKIMNIMKKEKPQFSSMQVEEMIQKIVKFKQKYTVNL